MVATYVGSGGNCGLLTSWLCRDLRNLHFDTGRYLSLYVTDGGIPHLAYYNLDHEKLEYAYFAGPSNGSCGPNYGWKCVETDSIGSSLTPMGIAIEEDANGYPVIAFQDASAPIGPARLVIARPEEAAHWDTPLNCGPIGSVFHTWYCEAADSGGATLSEADAVSMTVNQQGEVLVAYRELDSHPYPPEGSLKVAFEPRSVFGDDFELGDTSAWSGGTS